MFDVQECPCQTPEILELVFAFVFMRKNLILLILNRWMDSSHFEVNVHKSGLCVHKGWGAGLHSAGKELGVIHFEQQPCDGPAEASCFFN